MIIRQYKAKGVFVNTLIQVVALDDAVSLLAFSLCAAVAAQTESGGTLASAVEPLLINLGILVAAYLMGRLLCITMQNRSADHRISLTLAFILLLAGGCACFNQSPLLGCMMMGATYANVTRDKVLFKQVNRVLPPISMIFFVLSGMRLNLDALATVGVIGLVYFAVRIAGKMLGAWLGGRLIQAPSEVRRYLGLALIPQAGVSIGLAVLAQRILPPETGTLLSTIILSSSVLYEMIGPVSARRALILAGAIHAGARRAPLPEGEQPEGRRKPEQKAPGPARRDEKTPRADKPDKGEKNLKAEKAAKSDKAVKADKPERNAKPDKAARPDRPDKPEKPVKPEKTEKTDKAGKADKTRKADKAGKGAKPAPPLPEPAEPVAEKPRPGLAGWMDKWKNRSR